MQTLKIYSIFDVKAQNYSNPIYSISNGAMIRSFATIANDSEHPIGAHPEDYTLFEIGLFTDTNCEIKMLDAKIPLGTALEHVQESTTPPPTTPNSKFKMPPTSLADN